MKHSSLYFIILPLLLLLVATLSVFPFYQYYIDPDAVGYLSVAERYAKGDGYHAINGYWSPWSCWLTAILIKGGMASFKAGILINTLGASGFLIASHILFRKFLSNTTLIGLLNTTLALFLVYAIYKQSFADLWSFFFLLVIVLSLMHPRFIQRSWLWCAVGALGALAFMAKAYAFPYVILLVSTVTIVIFRKEQPAFALKTGLKVVAITLGTMLFFTLPWLMALHQKYGMWTTGTAGTLNLSWYLIGHPYYKDGIQLLVPPNPVDALMYWEDPYLSNGATPHFWNSPSLFFLQIVRVGYNALKAFMSMNEISAFFLPTALLYVFVISKKYQSSSIWSPLIIPAWAFVLFPLGYILIHFESRYLWFLLPFSLLMVGMAYEHYGQQCSRLLRNVFLVIVCLSYLSYPVLEMKVLYRSGEQEYQLAKQLREAAISGSFATNISQSKDMQKVMRLAWFSKNPYYYMPTQPFHSELLLQELERYHIKYYFHFDAPGTIANYQLCDRKGKPFPTVFIDSTTMGLQVFQLHDEPR